MRPVAASRFSSPGAYTPTHLAEKILTSRSALEGERKQVTVLFVDVSGFTHLSSRLDPEDVHHLMSRAFDVMLAEVHRYEGTVNQFLGDGIMALFGAPIAHEDHAQRAVRAALSIRDALRVYGTELEEQQGTRFEVRLGLNTGLVVVGSIGSDLRMDYTAVGDTTNVAARMQQAAAPGSVLIAEQTYRLAGAQFRTRDLGTLSLKGKTEPVPAWEVLSALASRSRLELEADRGLTPYVGRELELRVLLESFDKARAGRGQVVFLAGEPGMGKSRLLHEFRLRLADDVDWLEGRCASFGRSMAFHPLVDLLRRQCGIEEGAPEAQIVQRLSDGVLEIADDLAPALPFLRYLLGVDPGDRSVLDMDPLERRGEVFLALRRLVLKAAEARPQVIVWEDIHWVDPATEEYLLSTADSLAAHRVLCLFTYRTGYAPPFGDRSFHTRLVLSALPPHDSKAMADALLRAGTLPETLRALIVRKAEGNPFFVEEIVKSLRDTGAITRGTDGYVLARPVHELMVPDTVQDVIMARIDRLPDVSKRVLQIASVVGRRFSRRVLDRFAGEPAQTSAALRELLALEMIHETSLYPEATYSFQHALTHEVAYGSLLLQRRRELHRAIGESIEQLDADRLAERYAVLAYHFEKAEAWERALTYLLKAAERAAQAFATREALALYDQAEQAAGRLGHRVPAGTLVALHQARADLYALVSDFEKSWEEGARALAIARQAGDRLAEGKALVGMGLASWLGHRFDRALDDARQAIAVGEAIGAPEVLAGGHLTSGLVYEMTGRLVEARSKFDQVIGISRPARDVANESWALVFAAELKGWEGLFDEAACIYDEGIRLGRSHNVLLPVLEGLFMSGINLTGKGDYDGALALLEEGLALAEKVGDENYTPRYLNSLGWLHFECGDLESALVLNQRAATGARERADHESIGNADLNLGDIFLAKGDLAVAGELLFGVHRMVHDPATSEWMRWRYSMHLFASLGDLWLARGEWARAREAANQCLELATRTNSRKYLVRGWRLQGEIAWARRQGDESRDALQRALHMAEAIGNPTQLWQTHKALGRLHEAMGHPEGAREADVAARRILDQVRTGLRNPGLRAGLGAWPGSA